MVMSISTILSKVSERSWQTLSIGVAVAIGTFPIAGTLLLINSGSLSIKTENREIDFQGKGHIVTTNSQEKVNKLQKQFDELYDSYQELAIVTKARFELEASHSKAAARNRAEYDDYLDSQIEKVEQEIIKSGVRLDDVKESQKEVEEFVESATADDTIEE